MPRPEPEVVVSYEVWCRCGRPLRGLRHRTRQIVSCPSCGRKQFILPLSPWLVPAESAGRPPMRFRLRWLALVLVVGGLLAMGLSFLILRPYLRRSSTQTDHDASANARALLESGENQLHEGNAHLAFRDLDAALAQAQRHPDELNREELRRLEQLRRQADLLARLLDQPLEAIVHKARQHRSDDEWRAKLAQYRGRTIIFDDVLRRDAQGRPVLGVFTLQVDDADARIALEDLELLRQLPLDPPRRWLFGARLIDCRREEGGIWVLRFEPESAVLLTDKSAAAACCPQPLEQELLDVLKRQADWLDH